MNQKKYELPELPFEFHALEPSMSAKQVSVHYQKHHQAYVEGANKLFEEFNYGILKGEEINIKNWSKNFAFQIGGFILHNLFWQNLIAPGRMHEPSDGLMKSMAENFVSMEKFKALFSAMAVSVEGSGWACLVQDRNSKNLQLMQIEKHNVNVFPEFKIILLLDMFEHAYYIDYQNNKKEYVDNFWKIVNWPEVEKRIEQ